MMRKKERIRKRRYVKRMYIPLFFLELVKIPKDEMFLDVEYNRDNNEIVIKTLLRYDKKKGDD